MLASTLSRPRCGMPMQTSSRPSLGGRGEDRVEQRDDRLAALEREPLLADELGLQEGLERLGGVEPAQDAQLLVARRSWRRATSTRSWIHSRCSGSWMCMYSMPMVRQ